MKIQAELKIDNRDFVLIDKQEYLDWLDEQEDIEAIREARVSGEFTDLEDFMNRNGNNIARYRKTKNLKQTELAEMMGVDQSHLSRWESGKIAPSLEYINKLAKILECDVFDLFPA